MISNQSILVIDDDADIGGFIKDVALPLSLNCIATTEASTFLELLGPHTDLVILDLLMPHIDGIELLRVLGEQKCKSGVVLMSGVDKRVIETAEQLAAKLGLSIVGRLIKPFGKRDLEGVLNSYQGPANVTATESQRIVIQDEDLRKAVTEQSFNLHFQPQINIRTRKVVSIEGLVRWLHPEYGLVYPDRFIQRTEELGLIEELTWIVLRKGVACWHNFKDLDGNSQNLSINISSESLRDLRFPDKLEALLGRFGMPPEKLVLEVKESGLLDDLTNTLDVLARLRLKRFQLSVDDVGIGYSMLQQLRRIPATELKIDKSLVGQMLKNHDDRIVVEKTIEIGHLLGMRIVAEGVESQDQLDFLSEHGCDIAQGYFVYKPYPLAILLSWLSQYRPLATTTHLTARSEVPQR